MLRRRWKLVFCANALGGCLPAIFAWMAVPGATTAFLLRQAGFGLVYSWCIGTLCFLAGERFGIYMLWWYYNQMEQPNAHFRGNWPAEDALVRAVEALA